VQVPMEELQEEMHRKRGFSRRHRVDMSTGAYCVAVARVAEATRAQGCA
jgi:hypothetical protein